MSWLTIDDFKNATGIKIDDTIVEQSLISAERTIVKKLFISERYEYASPKSEHELYYPIADTNANGEIDGGDIDVWEEDENLSEYDLNSHVTSVENKRRRSVVELDADYPSANRKLYIDYKTARQPIEEMVDELKELQKLLSIDYLFTNVPFSKLQRGISSWTINGVNVSFDQNALIQAKEQNKKEEKRLFDQLRLVRADGIALGRLFHDRLDRQKHGLVFR